MAVYRLSIWALVLLVLALPATGAELKADMPAENWQFADADGRNFSMDSWANRVLVVNYVDPDAADLNEHFTDALKAAKDQGRLQDATYCGIGIADCAATWKPNFAIRAIAGRKAKKYKSTILFDYHGTLRQAWGLAKDTANVIVVDKNRICRAIVRGRVPDDLVPKLVDLVVALQRR
jgi:uncharacterized protein